MTSLETLADAVVEKSPLYWQRLHTVSHISVVQDESSLIRRSSSDKIFHQIQNSSMHDLVPRLGAAEFTVALLVHLSNQRIS